MIFITPRVKKCLLYWNWWHTS